MPAPDTFVAPSWTRRAALLAAARLAVTAPLALRRAGLAVMPFGLPRALLRPTSAAAPAPA